MVGENYVEWLRDRLQFAREEARRHELDCGPKGEGHLLWLGHCSGIRAALKEFAGVQTLGYQAWQTSYCRREIGVLWPEYREMGNGREADG